MTTKRDEPESLTAVAQGFEVDLRKLEESVREIRRLEIVSDKTLQRARRLLEACSEHQLRLASHLSSLVVAIQSAQGRVQANMDETIEMSRRVGARASERAELVERFAALGHRTQEIQGPVNALLEKRDSGASVPDVLAALADVLSVADSLVTESEALTSDAKTGGWVDIGKESDSLRQQILSARNKMLMLRRTLSAKAPS